MFSFGVWGQLENNIIRGTKHTNGTDKLSGRQSVREVCFFQAASALCPYHITLYRNCHRNKTRKSPHFKGNITFFQKIFIHSERIFTIFFTAVTRVPHAFFSAKSVRNYEDNPERLYYHKVTPNFHEEMKHHGNGNLQRLRRRPGCGGRRTALLQKLRRILSNGTNSGRPSCPKRLVVGLAAHCGRRCGAPPIQRGCPGGNRAGRTGRAPSHRTGQRCLLREKEDRTHFPA